MTALEVIQEFAMRLIKAVDLCDRELNAAYEKRQQTLMKLNEWFQEAYKEASDDVVGNSNGA